MKSINVISLIIIFSTFISGQDIGIDLNIGYSKLNMEQVNNYLNNSESVDYSSLLINPPEYNTIGFDLGYELGLSAKFYQFVLKISGNYLSSSGYWKSSDTIKTINHETDVSTFEVIASAGYNISVYKTASILFEGGIGYGFASSEINYLINSFHFYNELENINYSLSGGYFLSRLRGGFEAKLKWLVLRFVIGYKFANPVVLKGDSNINGVKSENQAVLLSNGEELEFDFSGICYAWGITVLL